MNKNLLKFTVIVCSAMTCLLTACVSKSDTPAQSQEDGSALVIDLDSIVIEPYMEFGVSLADVEKYMNENYADWEVKNPDSLECFEQEETGYLWSRSYVNGKNEMSFYFKDADATNLVLVSYDYFFPMPLEPIMAELEKLGFENKGEVKFDDFNADITYLYLSSDEKYEVQLSSWEKDGGSWAITFQLTDKNDLNHLVKKE